MSPPPPPPPTEDFYSSPSSLALPLPPEEMQSPILPPPPSMMDDDFLEKGLLLCSIMVFSVDCLCGMCDMYYRNELIRSASRYFMKLIEVVVFFSYNDSCWLSLSLYLLFWLIEVYRLEKLDKNPHGMRKNNTSNKLSQDFTKTRSTHFTLTIEYNK